MNSWLRRLRPWVALVVGLSGLAPAAAQPQGEELARMIERKLAVVPGYTAQIIVRSTPVRGVSSLQSARQWFRRPGYLRQEGRIARLGQPTAEVRIDVVDGHYHWRESSMGSLRTVTRVDLGRLQAENLSVKRYLQITFVNLLDPFWFLNRQTLIRWANTEWNNVPCMPVEGNARLADEPLVGVHGSTRFFFDLDHGFLRRWIHINTSGYIVGSMEVVSFTPESPAKPGIFDYTPPDNVKVIDATDHAISLLRRFPPPEK